LDLIVWISDTLLFCKEISEFLLGVNTVLDLAELGKLDLELLRIHPLIIVLSHYFD
jgi:hypothetical protein